MTQSALRSFGIGFPCGGPPIDLEHFWPEVLAPRLNVDDYRHLSDSLKQAERNTDIELSVNLPGWADEGVLCCENDSAL